MSVYIQPGVRVRIEQLADADAPRPLPLESGFSIDRDYEVLGLHVPSESAEAYLILRNDRDEMWFISNRHVRITAGGREPDTAPQLATNGARIPAHPL